MIYNTVTYTMWSDSYKAHYELQTSFITKKRITHEGARRKINKEYCERFGHKPKHSSVVHSIEIMNYI